MVADAIVTESRWRTEGRPLILILSAAGDDASLLAELERCRPPLSGRVEEPGLVAIDRLPDGLTLPVLSLARQTLPAAKPAVADSIAAWARSIVDRILSELTDEGAWRLHVGARYGAPRRERLGARAWHSATRWGGGRSGTTVETSEFVSPDAGRHRCELIEKEVLGLLKERRRRRLKVRTAGTGAFSGKESLVQVLLSAPDRGWISIVAAPALGEWRRSISPFPWGQIPVAVDKSAPSRAFAKLVESEMRMGCAIQAGETCVDLGASPGSWSYVALQRGARVVAVDRSPLREDLMGNPRLIFERGDAFRFQPREPVDWLLCDVIAAPERSIQLLLEWLVRGAMKRFVVSVKLQGPADHSKLEVLKAELPRHCEEWSLLQLCANKGEVCVFGRRRNIPAGS